MQAELKHLHSPDITNLELYCPVEDDNFSFLLQANIGWKGSNAADTFDILVCTPKWLAEHYGPDGFVLGQHKLIVFEYNYRRLVRFIEHFCSRCHGETWAEIARQLTSLGKWEFEYLERKRERTTP